MITDDKASLGQASGFNYYVLHWFQMSKTPNEDAARLPGRLPAGVVVKPPVSRELLEADTESDPKGAERFVEIIRRLRARSLPVGKA